MSNSNFLFTFAARNLKKADTMKKFEKITKVKDTYFFSIEEIKGVKYVHIFGCIWADDGRICSEEYVGFVEPLTDFIKHVSEDEDYILNAAAELNQCQEDIDEGRAIDYLNHYFDGKGADYVLDFSELTEDTPIGEYIN